MDNQFGRPSRRNAGRRVGVGGMSILPGGAIFSYDRILSKFGANSGDSQYHIEIVAEKRAIREPGGS
jgi:hypothetical protein